MMRRSSASRGHVSIARGLISLVSVAVMLAMLPRPAAAQASSDADESHLSDRERRVLDRIQNLEVELAGLCDLQARLAVIEEKIGAGPNQHKPEVSAGESAAVPDPPDNCSRN